MANDDDEPPTKDSSEDGVHRLRDILVEEVSLVDRAANKRKFLIVKRSTDVAKKKQPADAAANKAKAKANAKKRPGQPKAKPWEQSAAADEEGARKARRRAAAPDEEQDDAEKADDEENDDETEKAHDEEDDEAEKVDDEEDDEAEKADDEEDDEAEKADDEEDDEAEKAADEGEEEDDTAGAKRPKRTRAGRSTTKADDEDEPVVLPPAVKTAVLRALTQAIDRLVAIADRVKEADGPDDDTDVNVPEDLTDELDDLGELLEGIGERLPSSKSVAKGGARMAKDRLHRFEQAIKLLSEVLKELTEGKQPAEPSAGTAASTTKRAGQADVATLAANVQDLLQILKHQQVQLDRVRKAHGVSNAIPVDGGAAARRAPADVSWPLDMNRPISRDSVAKAVSFYEDND